MAKAGEICMETGKIFHPSLGEAIAHQNAIKERCGNIVEPYHCQHCGGWHVGRVKEKAHKNKYRDKG
jgi:hypothetical protein